MGPLHFSVRNGQIQNDWYLWLYYYYNYNIIINYNIDFIIIIIGLLHVHSQDNQYYLAHGEYMLLFCVCNSLFGDLAFQNPPDKCAKSLNLI